MRQMRQITLNCKLERLLNALPIVWFFSGFLLISNGQTYLAYFLIIATVYNIYTQRKINYPVRKNYLILPILIYLFSLITTYIYTNEMWIVIRTTLYFLPFALTTTLSRNDLKELLKIIPFSGVTIGIAYLYIHNFQGIERDLSLSGLNPIPLATTLVFYLCVSSMSLIAFSYNKKEVVLIFTGILFLIFSIVMTETRSAWLCTIAIVPIIAFAYKKHVKACKVALLAPIAISLLLYTSFSSEINSRINRTISEANSILNGNYATSIGVRLQLWKTSLEIIEKNHYIFPEKEDEIIKYFKEKLDNGAITPYTFHHIGNSHNQYINAWMRSGILGLASTLILIFAPPFGMYTVYGLNKSLIVIAISTTAFFSGMTEVPLTQISSYQAYLMALLICFIIEERRE